MSQQENDGNRWQFLEWRTLGILQELRPISFNVFVNYLKDRGVKEGPQDWVVIYGASWDKV